MKHFYKILSLFCLLLFLTNNILNVSATGHLTKMYKDVVITKNLLSKINNGKKYIQRIDNLLERYEKNEKKLEKLAQLITTLEKRVKNSEKNQKALRVIAYLDAKTLYALEKIKSKQEINGIQTNNDCSLPFSQTDNDFDIYVGGAYGGKKLDFQIDDNGHSATQIDVNIHEGEKPIILMLAAHEPTIWNISRTKETKIIGIYTTGYYKQVIAGIDTKNIPILSSTYKEKGSCGYSFFSKGKAEGKDLNSLSEKLFQKGVTKTFIADGSVLNIGDQVIHNESFIQDGNSPDSYKDSSFPLSGKAGLDEAIEKGIIRKATYHDINAYHEYKLSCNPEKTHLYAPVGEDFKVSERVYVILDDFTYPAGLYGSNSATFFINTGVPKPKGKRGHSVLIEIKKKCN